MNADLSDHCSFCTLSKQVTSCAYSCQERSRFFRPGEETRNVQRRMIFLITLQGFITAAGSGASSTVRICVLDAAQRLDTPWPLQRLPQRATVTALGWYPQAHLHIVAVTHPVGAPAPVLEICNCAVSYSSLGLSRRVLPHFRGVPIQAQTCVYVCSDGICVCERKHAGTQLGKAQFMRHSAVMRLQHRSNVCSSRRLGTVRKLLCTRR